MRTKELKQITVGIGAVIADDSVLFVRRFAPNVPEYHKKWELPGGKVEHGESVELTIEREIKEETGYTVQCIEIVPFSYTRAFESAEHVTHVVVLCGRCEVQATESPNPLSEHDGGCWIKIPEIPFSEIIPGSKEFLIWCLKDSWPKALKESDRLYQMRLQLVDNSQNKQREYHVSIEYSPGSSEPYLLIREWGRIGRKLSRRTNRFLRLDDALRKATEIIRKRRDHGYSLTSIDSNHPLRTWLEENPVPIAEHVPPKQGRLF